MTEYQRYEAVLKMIESLFQQIQAEAIGPHTTLKQSNTSGLILDAVGEEILNSIASDYLDFLHYFTIYEQNGDCAISIYSSNWCRFLDRVSGRFSDRASGNKWQCLQTDWEAAKRSIETGQAVDIECLRGIRLYALPIFAGEEIVGSINFGYGEPPKDWGKLVQIADRYSVNVEELEKYAHAYESPPASIIESAKKRLQTSAKLIGEIIKRKQIEQERDRLLVSEQAARAKVEATQRQASNILETIADGFVALDTEWRYIYINSAVEIFFNITYPSREDLLGKNIWIEFPELVGSNFDAECHRAIAEQVKVEFEFYSPSNKWFQIQAYPSPNGLAIYFQDITSRKQTEEQLAIAGQHLVDQLADVNQLHDLSIRLSTTLELDSVLEEVLKAVVDLQNADMGALMLYDPKQDDLYVAASVGFSDEYLNFAGRISSGIGCCGLAIAQKHRMIIEDAETNPIFAPHIEYAKVGGYRAIYSTPLLTHNSEIIGTIATYFRYPHRPSKREINLVELYAQEAGRAIENARLYHRLQEAEQEKDESLAILNALLENAPVGFCLYDRQGRYVRINEYLANINGVSPEKHIGKTVWDILPLDLASKLDLILQDIVNTKEPVLNVEIAGKTNVFPNRQYYWLTSYYPVPSITGEIIGIGCTVTDITELKRTEKALQESEARFRCLFDSNAIGIIELDNDRIIEANDIFLEMLGYTRNELLAGNLSWREMTPKKYLDLDDSAYNQLLTIEFFSPYEKEYICKDGSLIPILLGGALLQRSPLRFICFVLNISARKQTEQKIAESEQRLRLSLEAGRMGIWDWNILTGEIKWSDNLEQIHGMTAGSFDGTFAGFQKIIHPEDRELLQSTIARAIEEKTNYELEFRIVWPDGSIHWMSGKGKTFCDETGNAVRMIGAGTDVTARNQVKEALRQKTEELEQANRVKDEFLAILSHELRSPLNAILGWANLLCTRKFDEATTTRALKTIERNARLQTQLIEDLLDVSRILRGKLSLNMSEVNLVSTIEASIDTMRLAAEAKSIQIETAIEPNVGLVLGDPNRLQQIVWNLLTNAIKFTPQAGRVEIGLKSNGTQVQISVSDTGKGISADFLPYVFDRFRQGDASITRVHGGLGLGLAIVRNLVDLHGGTIKVKSEGEGKGTIFIINLPLIASNSLPVATSSNPSYVLNSLPLKGLQIVVVDDETDTREFYKIALENSGATVIEALSAQEALAAIERLTPDVLVSDIGMPGEDGYTLIRKVRLLPPDRGGLIPAVALTAYARDEDRCVALDAGFQTHIPKPIEPHELVAAIINLVGRSLIN